MTTRTQKVAAGGAACATYFPSDLPGLYGCMLVDDGPPRARIHDRLVLLTLVEGESLVQCRGEVHLLRPGSVLMVEPGNIHRDLQKTAYRAVLIVIHPDLVKALRGPDAGPLLGPVVPPPPALCAEVMALFAAMSEGRDQSVQERLAARLFRELRPLWTHHAPRPEPPLATRVRRAFAASPGVTLSLDELAGQLRCTPSYLCRVFAGHMAVGPHAYQLLGRLLLARRLVECGRPIAIASQLSGFSDESHLRRHFRRRFAATPSRYRKELIVHDETVDSPEDAPW